MSPYIEAAIIAFSFFLKPYEDTTVWCSWYGKPFHGRITASGEVYDMMAFTAAHRTYPFGTVLLVEEIKEGGCVAVVVNDTGPFVDGRSIDLSLAAFKQLRGARVGLIQVRYKVVGRIGRPYILPSRRPQWGTKSKMQRISSKP